MYRALLDTQTWAKVASFRLVTAVEVAAQPEPNGLSSLKNASSLIFRFFQPEPNGPSSLRNALQVPFFRAFQLEPNGPSSLRNASSPIFSLFST